MFCCTLCRGQNLGILPLFTKCLEKAHAKLPVKKMPFRCPYTNLKVDRTRWIIWYVDEWSSISIEGSIISCLNKVSSCIIQTLVVWILDMIFTLFISKLYFNQIVNSLFNTYYGVVGTLVPPIYYILTHTKNPVLSSLTTSIYEWTWDSFQNLKIRLSILDLSSG